MAPVKLQLTCGRCKSEATFEDETTGSVLDLARVEGWMSLWFSEFGSQASADRLSDLCPKCFSEIQYSLKPSTLSLFGGAYESLRMG